MPVRKTSRIAFIASRSGILGRWHANGWALRAGSSGSILSHSASVMRQPSSLDTNPIYCLHQVRLLISTSPNEIGSKLVHKPMNLGAVLLGGAIFGIGWAVMGFCPGTSVGALG